MGSVGFDGEDESQPSTSSGKKYKLPRMLLDGCGAVSHASVPRKLRSAIKKRGRESVTIPLPISRKQYHVSNGVETLRKYGAKKSKLNKKQGHITKDEQEVAEALYALAGMFSDADKANQPGLDDEQPEAKSPAIRKAGSSMDSVEDTGILTLQEESRKITSKVTFEAVCHSSLLVDSTAHGVKFQSLGDAQQSSKQPPTSIASGVQSASSLVHRLSACNMNPTAEQANELQQVAAFGVQYDKNYYPVDDKCNGLFPSPSLFSTAPLSSKSQEFCERLPAWFENNRFASQPPAIDKTITTEKYTRVAVEPTKSWKRCSAHVYIGRLIKVLQASETKEGLLEKSTQVISSEGADLSPHASNHNQMVGIDGKNGGVSFAHSATEKVPAKIQNDLLQKRPVQDQQLASETSALCSAKQGYDFLSLGTGVNAGVCGLNTRKDVNKAGRSHEAPGQFHVSYMQSENNSAMLFSLPQNGYSSTFNGHNSALAAQQVQIPQYHSSTVNSNFTSLMGHQLESQQQRWAAQLQTRYSAGGVADWKNGGRDPPSMLNYAHALFPHLHAALGSKYQQFSTPQQQPMAMNSLTPLSNMKKHQNHHLPLGFERNGAAFCPENIPQLQLPCNQRL